MMFLAALGEFPEMVLGLAFSLGCALLLAFACLRLLLALMTRRQGRMSEDDNVSNDPSHVGSLLLLGAAVAGPNIAGPDIAGPSNGPDGLATNGFAPNSLVSDERGSGATGSPYLLPAASARNRFVRVSESDEAPRSRVVEFPVPVAGGVGPSWNKDSWSGDGWSPDSNDAA